MISRISFENDYSEGTHERILKRLQESNLEQTTGYSEDAYSEDAKRLIKEVCQAPDADVHFLVGGTQTNMTVITAALRPHQGVISHQDGHISVHESGAIEATGHKVLALTGEKGKLTAETIATVYENHISDASYEHTVQPKMVYISHPTECGTLYTKQELAAISEVCQRTGMYLFLDGARLGYALAAENDVTLTDIARYCDVFYIGGTKVGALFGEAVVITRPELKADFRYIIKQRGGLLAKGRLLGIQFQELFKDGLYEELGGHGVKMGKRLKEVFTRAGCDFLVDSKTNQQFPILEEEQIHFLKDKYNFSIWEKMEDTRTAVRFCTSWATKEESIAKLEADIEQMPKKG